MSDYHSLSDEREKQNYLVVALQVLIPPRRLEYRTLQIVYGRVPKDEDNYIQIGNESVKFYLRDFKNSESKGEQILEIPFSNNSGFPQFIIDRS